MGGRFASLKTVLMDLRLSPLNSSLRNLKMLSNYYFLHCAYDDDDGGDDDDVSTTMTFPCHSCYHQQLTRMMHFRDDEMRKKNPMNGVP